jgi:hypothetical protein
LAEKNGIKKIHIIVASILIILIANYFIQAELKNKGRAVNSEDEVGVLVAYLDQDKTVIPLSEKSRFTAEALTYPNHAQKIATFPENGGETIIDPSLFFMIYIFTLIVLSLAFYMHITRRDTIR